MKQMAISEEGARGRALGRAVLALMEPETGQRIGQGPVISSESHEMLIAAVGEAAPLPEERDDFLAQARALAEANVDRSWPEISAIVREAGEIPRFRDVETLPLKLFGSALRPVPKADDAVTEVPSSYEVSLRHRVAHGIVGAALSGRPASVGFSGFRVLSDELAHEFRVPILMAGEIADTQLTGAFNSDDGCGCHAELIHSIAAGVGARPEARPEGGPARALGAQLDAHGLTTAFHDLFVERWEVAGELVEKARASGMLDREAARLHRAGRITINPAEVAFAVNTFVMGDVPSDDLERPAIRAAAMAVAERYLGGGPVHATLAWVGQSPEYRNEIHAKATNCAVPYAATLAGLWLTDRPAMGVAPVWDEVAPPEGVSDQRSQRFPTLALAVLKRHWPEIEAAAAGLIEAGAIDLPACPRRGRATRDVIGG